MPTDVVMLSVTALLALMALAAAVVAVRAARRSTDERQESAPHASAAMAPEALPRAVLVPLDDADTRTMAPRHVEGRVIVPPTGQQVVGAALSRPHVRLAILLHGLTYALRPESRDRITALMRREYRRRRRERLAAGRRAVRAVRPSTDAWMAEPWIGELPARPRSSTKVDS
ncbi:MAG: hypothetical protein ACRDOT_05985 [Aeromicrobium sp.]